MFAMGTGLRRCGRKKSTRFGRRLAENDAALASTMRLTIAKVEGAAREAVDSCHRHHVAGAELAKHPVKLAPVGPHTGRFLAVDVAASAPALRSCAN